jgi:hypothetical protein
LAKSGRHPYPRWAKKKYQKVGKRTDAQRGRAEEAPGMESSAGMRVKRTGRKKKGELR